MNGKAVHEAIYRLRHPIADIIRLNTSGVVSLWRGVSRRGRGDGVRNPFSSIQAQQPFLSPLGRRRRLPAIAAPVVLTVVGGVALVAAFGTIMFGLQPSGVSSVAAGLEVAEAQAETPQPRTVTVEREREKPEEEEPALLTALPQSPITETGEVVLEPVPAQADASGDDAPAADADQALTAAIPALPAEITAFAPQPRPAAPPATQAASSAASAGDASMRTAVVRRAVNMRAAPNGRAQVLTVVPASSEVRAETDCSWCEISYQGRSGFIYKSFIDYR